MLNIDYSQIKDLNGTQVQKLLKMLEPKMNKYIPHIPTPKQQVFMNLDNREAFFGGAAGGGKSDALLMDALQNVTEKGYSAIIFRKSYADLVKPGALIDRAKEWLVQFPEVRWSEKEKKFEWFEDLGRGKREVISTLQFGYLENDNDRFNYQGGEYQYAGFDELTHISEVNYRYIFSRLRKLKGSTIPLKIRGASNPPDDDQGIWVYDRFVNKKTKNPNCLFVPSGLDDNPHLDKESYEEMLEALDPVTRARLRDGNWEVIRKGNMFKRDWVEFVDSAPQYRRRLRFWDMAATVEGEKKNKDPDFTVGFLMSEANGIFYIEDIVHVRKRPQETEELQKNCAESDGYNTVIREEQEPGSSGIAIIDNKARGIFKGKNYKGIRVSGSKVQRALAVSAAMERGQIKVVRGCRNIEALFNEMEVFPGGKHDDLVDGLSGAFNELGTLPEFVLPVDFSSGGSYWGGIPSFDSFGDSLGAGYWR